MEYTKERLEPDEYDDFRLISVFDLHDIKFELNIVTYGPMNDMTP